MSSPPDTVAPEQLSEEEREHLEWVLTPPTGPGANEIRKLLRIHDRLQARVGELEGWLEKANARIEYLVLEKPGQVAGLEARVAELEQRVADEQEQTRAHVQAQMLAEGQVRELVRNNHASKDLRQAAQHRCALLEAEIHQLETIIARARAEGFGVIRGKDLEPPGQS